MGLPERLEALSFARAPGVMAPLRFPLAVALLPLILPDLFRAATAIFLAASDDLPLAFSWLISRFSMAGSGISFSLLAVNSFATFPVGSVLHLFTSLPIARFACLPKRSGQKFQLLPRALYFGFWALALALETLGNREILVLAI